MISRDKIVSKTCFSLMFLFIIMSLLTGLALVLQIEELVFGCFVDDRKSVLQMYIEIDYGCEGDEFWKWTVILLIGNGAYFYLMLFSLDLFEKEWKKRRWLD